MNLYEFVLNRVENISGRGNAGYQHFSPIPTMFLKGSYLRVVKTWDCMVKSSVVLKISRLKGGPSWDESLQKTHPKFRKPFDFHSWNTGSRKTSDNKRN